MAVTSGPLVASPAVAAPVTVSDVPSPTYQTNGRVNAIITVGKRVYIGGDFTSVRPAGSPSETNEVQRQRLAAFSAVTGRLLRWSPGANSTVNALAASPDGHTIYVGGKFRRLAGQQRHNLGAVRASNGQPTHFRADTDRRVLALAASRSRVYVGGKFTTIDRVHRSRLAAVSTRGHVLRSWRPAANRFVRSIALSANHKDVFVGGDFSRVSHRKQRHLAKISLRGRVVRFPQHPSYPVVQIVATRHNLYLAGNGAGGHAASYTVRGHFRWVKQTDGAVHSVALRGGVLYVGGQFGNVCVHNTKGPTKGFDCQAVLAPRRHLAALTAGHGSLLPWDPGTNSTDGVFVVSANSRGLQIGGDFTTVAGVDHQGYAEFTPSGPPT